MTLSSSHVTTYSITFYALTIFSLSLLILAPEFDKAVIQYFADNQTEHFRLIWGTITDYGHGTKYFIFCLIGLSVGYRGKRYSAASAQKLFEFSALSFASLVSAGLVIRLLKWMIGRPRPNLWLENESVSFSFFSFMSEYNAFPSGHTQTAFTVAFLIGLLAPRYRAVFFLAATLIGVSRVVLLKHWPSDIMMGAAIGVTVPAIVLYYRVHISEYFYLKTRRKLKGQTA